MKTLDSASTSASTGSRFAPRRARRVGHYAVALVVAWFTLLPSHAEAGDYRSKPATGISGVVWQDLDGDGKRDADEPVVPGITVELLDSSGNPTGLTTTTDGSGFFSFSGIEPGDYMLRYNLPPGVSLTQPNAAEDNLDSDADPGTYTTGVVSVGDGEFVSYIDAGLVGDVPGAVPPPAPGQPPLGGSDILQTLPRTGSTVLPLVLIGGLLLAVGRSLLAVGRRAESSS